MHIILTPINLKDPKDPNLKYMFTIKLLYTYFWWMLPVGVLFQSPCLGCSKIELATTARHPQISQKGCVVKQNLCFRMTLLHSGDCSLHNNLIVVSWLSCRMGPKPGTRQKTSADRNLERHKVQYAEEREIDRGE